MATRVLNITKDRPLSPDQQARVHALLNSKGVTAECPACGHSDWTLGTSKVAILTLAESAIGDAIYPAVQTICSNCGFFRMFSTKIVGNGAEELT